MAKIIIPTPLRHLIHDHSEIIIECNELSDIINTLKKDYPQFCNQIFSENYKLKPFIRIYLNSELICISNELKLKSDDEIIIVCALAGG